jgi:imidazolonepropionase-like amidohydrolase
MTQTLFTNVILFDGTGSPPVPRDVRIDGDRIVAVENPGADPGDARVIDGGGGTLMPGLIDPHGHLDFGASVDRVPENTFTLPPKERLIAAIVAARTMLDHGYTSVVSGGSFETRHFGPDDPPFLLNDVLLQREIEAGHLPGPRIVSCAGQWAPAFAHPELNAPFGYIERSKRTPDPQVARDHVKGVARAGAQIVKIGLNGESGVAAGTTHDLQLHDEEVEAIVETAHDLGLTVSAHVYSDAAVKQALQYGIDTLYHCSFMQADTADLMAQKADSIFVGVSLGALWATMYDAGLPPAVIEKMEARPTWEAQLRSLALMHERGIKALPGGDYGFGFTPIGRNARDLELFVTHGGHTAAEVLSLATSYSAGLMRRGHELGQIKPGYLADLLIVGGDPTQDIAILQDRERIKVIMKGGQSHKG